ncbi:MAG TPA: DUF2244 domain-containing protein [Azospira sp.]|nr:DUF2244 domain-containing protein [Azospira sp.]
MAGQAWVTQPERAPSSTPAAALIVAIVAIAAVSGGIATAFAAFGAWPVLPFAGLEIAVLGGALHHLQRHAGDEERLELDADRIRLTRIHGGRRECHEFSRYWARLRIDEQRDEAPGAARCRLLLRAHGREVEIGRALSSPQKKKLAAELSTRLGAATR